MGVNGEQGILCVRPGKAEGENPSSVMVTRTAFPSRRSKRRNPGCRSVRPSGSVESAVEKQGERGGSTVSDAGAETGSPGTLFSGGTVHIRDRKLSPITSPSRAGKIISLSLKGAAEAVARVSPRHSENTVFTDGESGSQGQSKEAERSGIGFCASSRTFLARETGRSSAFGKRASRSGISRASVSR